MFHFISQTTWNICSLERKTHKTLLCQQRACMLLRGDTPARNNSKQLFLVLPLRSGVYPHYSSVWGENNAACFAAVDVSQPLTCTIETSKIMEILSDPLKGGKAFLKEIRDWAYVCVSARVWVCVLEACMCPMMFCELTAFI